jgi:hypothetical protein
MAGRPTEKSKGGHELSSSAKHVSHTVSGLLCSITGTCLVRLIYENSWILFCDEVLYMGWKGLDKQWAYCETKGEEGKNTYRCLQQVPCHAFKLLDRHCSSTQKALVMKRAACSLVTVIEYKLFVLNVVYFTASSQQYSSLKPIFWMHTYFYEFLLFSNEIIGIEFNC